MPNTPGPRKFYAIPRLILMQSLMEDAGFVVMEAMANGIPVMASNRGGLPETTGSHGHHDRNFRTLHAGDHQEISTTKEMSR